MVTLFNIDESWKYWILFYTTLGKPPKLKKKCGIFHNRSWRPTSYLLSMYFEKSSAWPVSQSPHHTSQSFLHSFKIFSKFKSYFQQIFISCFDEQLLGFQSFSKSNSFLFWIDDFLLMHFIVILPFKYNQTSDPRISFR